MRHRVSGGNLATSDAMAGNAVTTAAHLSPARFQALLVESPDLSRLVRSPVFTADVQEKALSAVLQSAGIGGIAANFLKVVAGNRRLFAVGDIIKGFSALVARHKGEVSAEVTVAEPLSDARLAEVKESLNTVTGKDVMVDVKVDPSIIGTRDDYQLARAVDMLRGIALFSARVVN